MNIETKYLIRWGVPGWILIISLVFYATSKNGYDIGNFDKATNIFAAGAILTIIGIPLGYILNQIHHVWI